MLYAIHSKSAFVFAIDDHVSALTNVTRSHANEISSALVTLQAVTVEIIFSTADDSDTLSLHLGHTEDSLRLPHHVTQ